MSHRAGAFTLTLMFDQGHLRLVIIDPSEFHLLLQHDNTREHYPSSWGEPLNLGGISFSQREIVCTVRLLGLRTSPFGNWPLILDFFDFLTILKLGSWVLQRLTEPVSLHFERCNENDDPLISQCTLSSRGYGR